MIIELVNDFSDALATMPQEHAKRKAVELLGGAVRLSAYVLADDPLQLCSQRHGRFSDKDDPLIASVLARGRELTFRPWLRPLTPTLTPPGGPLLRSLAGHGDMVCAVAVAPDGRRAISGSWDKTLKVWDLESGEALATFTGEAAIPPVRGRARRRDHSCWRRARAGAFSAPRWHKERVGTAMLEAVRAPATESLVAVVEKAAFGLARQILIQGEVSWSGRT